MPSLELGASGAAVKKLQQALADAGFAPGAIDGDFGAGTEAAVLAFQRSQGLLPDGVAGPRTQAALGMIKIGQLPSVLEEVDVQVVAQMFPATPLGHIKTHLPYILAALKEANLVDKPMVLTALATIRAETESFEPVSEGLSRFNTSPSGPLSTCMTSAPTWATRARPMVIATRGGAISSSPDERTTALTAPSSAWISRTSPNSPTTPARRRESWPLFSRMRSCASRPPCSTTTWPPLGAWSTAAATASTALPRLLTPAPVCSPELSKQFTSGLTSPPGGFGFHHKNNALENNQDAGTTRA